jgi:hypothetical protein
MSSEPRQWTLDMLLGIGAEIEILEGGQAAVMLEENAAAAVGLPAFCELDFDANDELSRQLTSPDGLERLARLLEGHGRGASVVLQPQENLRWPREESAESFFELTAGKRVLTGLRHAQTRYLVVYARYTAVSDEKREGLVSAAVNLDTQTFCPGLGAALEGHFYQQGLSDSSQPLPEVTPKTLHLLDRQLRVGIESDLADFQQSMTRRSRRDGKRIYDYFTELLSAASSPPQGRQRRLSPEEQQQRAAAIAAEYRKKVDDLGVKYQTTISVEPLCRLSLVTQCMIADFDVLMGKHRTHIELPWNPLTRSADLTLCRCCERPAPSVRLCREFHWVATDCWKSCTVCGKNYCPICKPRGCEH